MTFDQQRAVASLAGLFGTVALLLAAVGMYGVTASWWRSGLAKSAGGPLVMIRAGIRDARSREPTFLIAFLGPPKGRVAVSDSCE